MVQRGLFPVAMQKKSDIRRVRLPLKNIKRCRFNRLFI